MERTRDPLQEVLDRSRARGLGTRGLRVAARGSLCARDSHDTGRRRQPIPPAIFNGIVRPRSFVRSTAEEADETRYRDHLRRKDKASLSLSLSLSLWLLTTHDGGARCECARVTFGDRSVSSSNEIQRKSGSGTRAKVKRVSKGLATLESVLRPHGPHCVRSNTLSQLASWLLTQ